MTTAITANRWTAPLVRLVGEKPDYREFTAPERSSAAAILSPAGNPAPASRGQWRRDTVALATLVGAA